MTRVSNEGPDLGYAKATEWFDHSIVNESSRTACTGSAIKVTAVKPKTTPAWPRKPCLATIPTCSSIPTELVHQASAIAEN